MLYLEVSSSGTKLRFQGEVKLDKLHNYISTMCVERAYVHIYNYICTYVCIIYAVQCAPQSTYICMCVDRAVESQIPAT